MSTLFETDVQSAGWHLSYLEILNWGTFHDKIYRLSPLGKNSLLTGANGSGKTTVVDALVTLLVPPGKRHYNQSSGADRKKERDETSYFLGAYGTLRDEDSTSGATQYLRGKDGFSVLLACFKNESFQQEATLAQVRWFSSGVLKRLYLVANAALETERDLVPFDAGSGWKKALSSRHPVKFYDTFALYGQAFSSLFGLKSDKALSLFSHVVGVKVLGDLNEFIRENMLDTVDMEEDFDKLKKNYEDLLGAHKQIEKAREQLRLLEPAISLGERWTTIFEQKTEIDRAYEVLAPVFADQELRLLGDARMREEARLASASASKAQLDSVIDDLRRQERDLEFALRDSSRSGLLATLDRDDAHRHEVLATKEKARAEYAGLAENLGLGTPRDAADFWACREEGTRQKAGIEEQSGPLTVAWAEERARLQAVLAEKTTLDLAMRDLLENSDAIPRSYKAWRDRLAHELDLSSEVFPFFASLVRVRDPLWRPAIEALFKDIALAILVEPEHEPEVRAWVLKNPAPGLSSAQSFLVLRAVGEEQFFVAEQADLVVDRLEVRKSVVWEERLVAYIRKQWDFQTCSGVEDLVRSPRGITQDGWVRDGRHWSLLAPGWDDPLGFVLGWENELQRRSLAKNHEKLVAEIERLESAVKVLDEKRRQNEGRLLLLAQLLAFSNWTELDVDYEKQELATLAQRRSDLAQGDEGLDRLQTQLAELRLRLKDHSREKDEVAAQLGRLKKTLEEFETELVQAKKVLSDFDGLDLDEGRRLLEPWLKKVNIPLDLGSLVKVRDEVSKTLVSERKRASDELKLAERELEVALHKFINPGADLSAKFPEWTGETASLLAKADALEDFSRLYDKIRREDLPGHQKRFKDWLNQRLIEDIADFRTSMENHLRGIHETVRELNSSLKSINYGSVPSTYIQLHVEESKDVQIRDFRRMLKEALNLDSEGDLEQAFHRIRIIIQSLSDNEVWRRKVTDVRHWLQFAAVERFTEDGTQRQYYQDSQSLSGGEKAKLAYTILASAIAHQFGIRAASSASRSLRFAVVDEAFSKVDPENSKFAMKLFEQMNLQLMVVTPLDKINVVEDYIHTIHYVENKRRKTSAVFDLAIENYRQGVHS